MSLAEPKTFTADFSSPELAKLQWTGSTTNLLGWLVEHEVDGKWEKLAVLPPATLSTTVTCQPGATAFRVWAEVKNAAKEVKGTVLAKPELPVIWEADPSKPLEGQWASISTAAHCAEVCSSTNIPDTGVYPVEDSRFAGGWAHHFHMGAGDKSCYSGRAELGQADPYTTPDRRFALHDEVWVAFEFVCPSTYPLNSPVCADGGLFQIHVEGSGYSLFGLSVGRQENTNSEGPGTPHPGGPGLGYLNVWHQKDNVPSSPQEVNTVSKGILAEDLYKVVLHYKVEEDDTGLEVLYLSAGDDLPQQVFSREGVPTCKTGKETQPLHARIGLYPDGARSTETPELDLRVGRLVVAGSRAAAETAFS